MEVSNADCSIVATVRFDVSLPDLQSIYSYAFTILRRTLTEDTGHVRQPRHPLGGNHSCLSSSRMRTFAIPVLQVRTDNSRALQICRRICGVHEAHAGAAGAAATAAANCQVVPARRYSSEQSMSTSVRTHLVTWLILSSLYTFDTASWM